MNQLIYGDFYNELLKIRTNTIDLILTDLPYNITQNTWDLELNLPKMWELVHHVLKDNGVFITTASQPFSSKLVMSNIKEFRHEWIWEKAKGSNFLNIKREPFKEHESVFVFSKGNWIYNPIKQPRKESKKSTERRKYISNRNYEYTKNNGNYGKAKSITGYFAPELRYPSSIQYFDNERGLHPTQKPIKLFEYLIKTYSNEGDTILDYCAGSGTTAIACLNTNRNYICIEKEEKYYNVIKNRIASHMTHQIDDSHRNKLYSNSSLNYDISSSTILNRV